MAQALLSWASDLPLSPASLMLANLVVLAASFLQASVGVGFALLAVPLLAVIDLQLVPGPSMLVSLGLTAPMFLTGRRHVIGAEVVNLLIGIAVGTVIGAIALSAVPKSALGLVFGILILAGVSISSVSRPLALSKGRLVGAGMAAGMMGTASGVHGPPLIVVYQHETIHKIRATIGLVFSISIVLSLAALVPAGMFDLERALLGAYMAPGVVCGYFLALRYRDLIGARTARIMMLVIASASAVVLIVRSLA